jgi:hypothetical protein
MSMNIAMSVWQSIRKRARRRASPQPNAERIELIRVPARLCRHYYGFRYGCNAFNPYENYIVGLHRGFSQQELRRKFEEFIVWNRPRNFAEVLGIQINPSIPLWSYPWGEPAPENHGWHLGLDEIPDILTHFCEEGVRRSRIEEEYLWLHRAYQSIKQNGYRPKDQSGTFFGDTGEKYITKQNNYRPENHSYIKVREMTDGFTSVYLVEDGNHRLSALVALGVGEVLAERLPFETVRLSDLPNWPQVKRGIYLPTEAEQLLRAYLGGVDDFPHSFMPATLLDA